MMSLVCVCVCVCVSLVVVVVRIWIPWNAIPPMQQYRTDVVCSCCCCGVKLQSTTQKKKTQKKKQKKQPQNKKNKKDIVAAYLIVAWFIGILFRGLLCFCVFFCFLVWVLHTLQEKNREQKKKKKICGNTVTQLLLQQELDRYIGTRFQFVVSGGGGVGGFLSIESGREKEEKNKCDSSEFRTCAFESNQFKTHWQQ